MIADLGNNEIVDTLQDGERKVDMQHLPTNSGIALTGSSQDFPITLRCKLSCMGSDECS